MAAEAALEGSQPVDLSQHPSGIVPTLQNIVSTVNLDCELDLKEIALKARNAEYNPKRFAAVIMRIREPKTTALVFASGKMVCTGAKSEQQSKLAARKYARIIQKLNFPAKFKEFTIQNIVASCDVKFPIRLEGLAYSHGAFASYEPELFPGLIYRMRQPKIVLLIFVSGKIVLTGAKISHERAATTEACRLLMVAERQRLLELNTQRQAKADTHEEARLALNVEAEMAIVHRQQLRDVRAERWAGIHTSKRKKDDSPEDGDAINQPIANYDHMKMIYVERVP
ncbi:hypothetical protein QYE76_001282 [Lolium multiflorum]|uniref:Uncharacterized protein n=1 Tax=Lolium multiflorum TaxID=4521 RepID=A0AAD8RMM3_LOLMU|nr:hypothetical protein QYE76_001282 [Lolium multiflorum]